MSDNNQDKLTQVVVDAFAGTPDARLRAADDGAGAPRARLRARGRPEARRVAGRHRSSSPPPARSRPTSGTSSSCCRTRWACRRWSSRWRRRAPAASAGAHRSHRGHRRRPVLLARRARPAAGQRHRRRRARRADAVHAAASPTSTAGRWPARCSTSGPATATACTTCSCGESRDAGRAARLRTDAEGRYWFWSIKPTFYPGAGRRPGRRHAAR